MPLYTLNITPLPTKTQLLACLEVSEWYSQPIALYAVQTKRNKVNQNSCHAL